MDETDSKAPEKVSLASLVKAHQFFALLGATGILVFLLFAGGGAAKGNGLAFLTWAFIAAIGSFLAGSALGLLFGLPTVRRLSIVSPSTVDGSSGGTNQTKPNDRNAQLGYEESTNLEQVADWLTKIIIGLTLTQYVHWEARFSQLSYDLTCRMIADCRTLPAMVKGVIVYPNGSTVPGGFLMVFYASLGFLMAYLWMRAYFISEMEGAKTNAIINATHQAFERSRVAQFARQQAEAAKAQAEAERDRERIESASKQAATEAEIALLKAEADKARAEAQKATSEAEKFLKMLKEKQNQGLAASPTQSVEAGVPEAIATTAAGKVRRDARDIANELIEQAKTPQYPDDPWLGLFGGQATESGLSLSATVKQNEKDQEWFDLHMEVVQDPERDPLVRSVQYFLHPTFGSDPRTVSFGPENRAPLDLIAYGAFTVGVLADDGTKLELDLAKLETDERFLAR